MSKGMKNGVIIGLLVLTLVLTLAGCGKAKEEKARSKLNDQTTITLYQHETGETVDIPLGEYLCGVVAGEMDVNWPQEALAAQAIVARTFTMEKIQAGGVETRGTDASTDIKEFQAYQADKVNEQVRQAVAMTENKVIYHQGELIKAWFFSDGGGQTAATAVEGLSYDKEETPYIHSVEDPGIQLSDNENKQWTATFTMEELGAAVLEVTGQNRQQFTKVAIAEQGPSGRATKLQLDDLMVGVPALRLALGGEKMRSAMLTDIALHDGQLEIKGKGYGHGVGMSQWGARALAEQGKTAEEIIHYFFKDVEIKTL